MANLMPGDVFRFDSRNYISVMVNDCSCRAIPMDASSRVVKFGNGKEIVLKDYGRKIEISPNSEVPVLERRGWRGVLEFLRSRSIRSMVSAPEQQQNDAEQQTNNNENRNMKTTEKKSNLRPLTAQKPSATKPRGGLAAELAAAKAKLTPAAVEQKPEPAPKPAKAPKAAATTKPEPAADQTPAVPSKSKERYAFLKAQFDGTRPKSVIAKNLMKFNGVEDNDVNFRKAKANVNNFPSNPHPDGFKAAWAPEPGKAKPETTA